MATTGFLNLVSVLSQATSAVTRDTFVSLATEILQKRRDPRAPVEPVQLTPKRYIVAPHYAQRSAGPNVQASLRAIHDGFKESILRSEHEDGPKVMRMTDVEAGLLKARYGGLLIEEDVQYSMARSPLLPVPNTPAVPASAHTLQIHVECAGKPVVDASVVLMTDVAANVGYEARTDAQGNATVSLRQADTDFESVMIDPRSGCWSKTLKNVHRKDLATVNLTPLPVDGFGWGHTDTEAPHRGANLGGGVRIGIIDSGIAKHPSLDVKGGRNFIIGEAETRWDDDGDGHGTHCAGVVAALARQASIWGYAPKAEIFALRVFGGEDGGGFASDIAKAIEWAVDNGCDIVSMSLTSTQPSASMRKQIDRANDAGVLCVAATGNEAGAVGYPAKYPGVVGVAAIGRFGSYPKDSLHALAESEIKSGDGRYYLANFSNRSGVNEDDVDFCAPGVAVASTLPAEAFGAWDGTSMACPHVTGMAALALASSHLAGKGRDAARRDLLLDRLIGAAQDIGISHTYAGTGLPLLGRVL